MLVSITNTPQTPEIAKNLGEPKQNFQSFKKEKKNLQDKQGELW